MARYVTEDEAAVGTNKTIVCLTGGTAVRLKIYDFIVGSAATPADVATNFLVQRNTAAGTGTELEEVPLDPISPVATVAATGAHSAEPTYTAAQVLMNFSLNQRATFRWVAAPGSEMISILAASNGIGLKSLSSGGTPLSQASVYWEE